MTGILGFSIFRHHATAWIKNRHIFEQKLCILDGYEQRPRWKVGVGPQPRPAVVGMFGRNCTLIGIGEIYIATEDDEEDLDEDDDE